MKALAFALAGALAVLGASGCDTVAFCFDNCTGTTSTGSTTTGTGGAGGVIVTGGTGGTGGDCVINCTTSSGIGGCMPTNGGTEKCDGLDNDCNGTVDDDVDFTKGQTCGNCATNCYATLLNCDPLTITCTPPPTNLGTNPGTCVCGACAQDYFDLDKNGTCEYYCVKSATDDALCNNKDDDCDGVKDEDVDLCTSTTDCGKCGGNCVVAHGTPDCVHTGAPPCDTSNTACQIQSCDCNGPGDCFWDLDNSYATGCEYPCDLTNGGVEICDGLDNDCDGKIDNADDLSGDPALNQTCFGDPDGECAAAAHAGITACVAAAVTCTGMNVLVQGQQLETCNGKDDDCDGAVDNNPTDVGGSCGVSNIFPCALGTKQCMSGALACIGEIDPTPEKCDGIDNDCDGQIDLANGMVPPDAMGMCNVPTPPPVGATSPCMAGAKSCVGGTVQCIGAMGPTSTTDLCGIDANCDGALTNQPNTQTDVSNCGMCGNNCYAGAVHALFTCVAGQCTPQGCQQGFYDLDMNGTCEYPCTFVSQQEACNGVDDNCNGVTDEGVTAPSPVQVCGVSPAATTTECTSMVTVACMAGAWKCTFPANVCNPTCAAKAEVCDTLDNNCNGQVNENTPNYGKPCASDDGLPAPGHGVCRTTGTYVCNGANAVQCSAAKNNAAAGPELCDTLDNDCDGLVDETFNNKGTNATYYVKPAVTKVANSLWVHSYEASRPTATNVIPGTGNGYVCSAFNAADPNCNDNTIPLAPAGVQLQKTSACSVPNKVPWFNVTPIEAEQTCKVAGGRLCTTTDWTTSCSTNPPSGTTCTWGYNPRGAACTTTLAATKFCNLGPYDFTSALAGDQDGLLPTGSASLQNCWADWAGLLGNVAADGKVFDITGNLREITKSGVNLYPLMGGAFDASVESGAACNFTFYSVDQNFQLFDLGFRCCFTQNPT